MRKLWLSLNLLRLQNSIKLVIMLLFLASNSSHLWGWGIKRVGKTTLVHAAGNKIKESQLFNDVAMAIVSETPDVGEIQDTIADSLDIKFERRN
ncbi:hypothetical protein Gotur_016444 [Gossypium turneri]